MGAIDDIFSLFLLSVALTEVWACRWTHGGLLEVESDGGMVMEARERCRQENVQCSLV